MKGALLDTSFLISLSNADRTDHLTAKRYFIEMINRGTAMYLSTIVISEFEVRQRISDLGLNQFIIVPFNIDHAIAAGSLVDAAKTVRSDGYGRDAIKDDVKLLAQCELLGIEHFLTGDGLCVKSLNALRLKMPERKLPIGVSCSDEFTDAWFNPEKQMGLGFQPPGL